MLASDAPSRGHDLKLALNGDEVAVLVDAPSRGHDLKLKLLVSILLFLGCPLTGA